jgi:uncharacterized protein
VIADRFPQRVAELRRMLGELGEVAVAVSGGVDSSVLLHAAHAVLGERAVGVVADSPSLPRAELAATHAFAEELGARLEVVRTEELDDPRYAANRGDRCYFCKQALFDAMDSVARRHGIEHLAYGELADDLQDDRPGTRAAAEQGVLAPLRAAGLTKDDVRRYAREHGLAVATKPASACLASRIPVGTAVTAAGLATVERAEAAVRALGFSVLRVRHLGRRARLEVDADELERARDLRPELERVLADFAELELAVYRAPGAVSAGRSAAALPAAPAPGS